MVSRKDYGGDTDMPEIYYTSTDPVFGKMTIKQFIETEVDERGNYHLVAVYAWMKKYNLSKEDRVIWVSPKKWVANRYNLSAGQYYPHLKAGGMLPPDSDRGL